MNEFINQNFACATSFKTLMHLGWFRVDLDKIFTETW